MVKFLNQIDWFFLENPWVYEFMKIVYELKKMYFSEKSFNAVYLYQEGIDQQCMVVERRMQYYWEIF